MSHEPDQTICDFGINPDGTHRWARIRSMKSPDFLEYLQELRAKHPERFDRSERVRQRDGRLAVATCLFAPIHGRFRTPDAPGEWKESAWFDAVGRLLEESSSVSVRMAILSDANVFADVKLAVSQESAT